MPRQTVFLNKNDLNNLIKRFPVFELSYDERIHKKVYTKDDIFVIIPYGTKFYAWFTYYGNQNVCFICELYPNKKIKNITIRSCCFKSELSYGTVLYGTMVENKFFVIENLYYYCGKRYEKTNYSNKLNMIVSLFENDIKQISYNKQDIVFTSPFVTNNYNKLIEISKGLPYNIYGIKIIDLYSKNKSQRIFVHKQDKKEYFAIFKIKATIKNDIYETYYYDNGNVKQHNVAYIPSYTCSVMLNSLFRTIKENIRLDSLEESDDEEDFENISDDKYVDLNKTLNMKCQFSQKFNKWIPIEVVDKREKLITYNDLWTIENKFIKANRRTEFPRGRRF
tara:strand:+ start:3472 stop:4479 length:1008 start_codon:yes stop_codon:yes gene_type:complete